MPKVTATDGTRIFYKDWGTGRPAGRLTAQIVEGAEPKVYPGAPHGLFATHADRLKADLLDFVKT